MRIKSGNSFKHMQCLAVLFCVATIVPSQKVHAFELGSVGQGLAELLYMQQDWAAKNTHLSNADISKTALGAQNFIQNMADRGISFLANDELSQDEKKKEFSQLLSSSFDMKTIARFSLGRYWRVATDAEKKEYLDLFRKKVIDVYAQRFGDYDGQKLEVRSVRSDNEKDTLVFTIIQSPQGADVSVDWRVRYKNGKYQIVDVIVEGVSMSVTQRSDFASVIQRNGGAVESLLEHLRETNESIQGI